MRLLASVVAEAHRLADRPFILGVVGAPGAGKSTFVSALVGRLAAEHPAVVVSQAPMDGFHLANLELERLGLRHLKGIPDTFDATWYAALLHEARQADRGIVLAPEFDRSIEEPVADALEIPPGPGVLIAEGNYLALESGSWPRVRQAVDELWFLDVPLEECAERCRQRRLRYGADAATAERLVATVDAPNGVLVAATRDRVDRVLSPEEIERITGSDPEGQTPRRDFRT